MINAAALPQEKKSLLVINVLSIVVPLVVAILLGLPAKLNLGEWTRNFAHIIGAINTLTALALIAGLIFIKQQKVNRHRAAMTTAFALGSLFLICYVFYHLTTPPTRYGGTGILRPVYFFFLFSHIGLSLVVLPLVLRAMFFAVTNQFTRHVRIVRYAYPAWLYVSVTGVIVYLMAYWL